jgi:hypothetical protein
LRHVDLSGLVYGSWSATRPLGKRYGG